MSEYGLCEGVIMDVCGGYCWKCREKQVEELREQSVRGSNWQQDGENYVMKSLGVRHCNMFFLGNSPASEF